MSDEDQWKPRILLNMDCPFVRRLSRTSSNLIFLSRRNLGFPVDGVLYLPPLGIHSFSTDRLALEVEAFEDFIRSGGGLKGNVWPFGLLRMIG